jgi:hypothetical protein
VECCRELTGPQRLVGPKRFIKRPFDIAAGTRNCRPQSSGKGTKAEPQLGDEVKPKYNWGPVCDELMDKLREEGARTEGYGGQTQLERWAAERFPPDSCPSESLIRAKVRKCIAAYRREIKLREGQ